MPLRKEASEVMKTGFLKMIENAKNKYGGSHRSKAVIPKRNLAKTAVQQAMRNFLRKSLSPNQKSHKLAKLFGEQEVIIEEDEN